MSDEKQSFTVTDRRHFTKEGETREESGAEAPGSPRERPEPEDARPAAGEPAPDEAPVTFAGFVAGLGVQAQLLMAGGENEPPDLAGVRQLVSILEMLKDKTEGRRTDEETRLLEAILFEVRMGYVQIAERPRA